jgi:DNA (cytosine-5)-methyltransferase 1
MADGLLHDAPIWDDCRTFDGKPWRGLVDVISAGFPCQPFSVAGTSKADADERNGWPWVARIVREVGPRYIFLENVPGLLASSHGYFGTVLGDLAESGYDVRWTCLSAAQCGAPHLRNRLWIVAALADAERSLVRDEPGGWCGKSGDAAPESPAHGEAQHVADAEALAGWWSAEPRLGRVAHGVATRMDRLKALGNGQVPAVAAAAWRLLNQPEKETER